MVKVGEWKKLARSLRLPEAVIAGIDKDSDEQAEKILSMLFRWKQRNASDAAYEMLYDALRHMKREDLTENFLEIAL